MIFLKNNYKNKKGFLVLTLVLLVSATVLIIVTGVMLRTIGKVSDSADAEKSLKALSTVTACGEYALEQMVASTSATTTITNWGFASTTGVELVLAGETCYIYPIEDISGGAKLIKASSTISKFTKKIEIEVATNTPNIVINSWQQVADFR